MLMAVNGYYNGSNIILEEDVPLSEGQKVIVTILDAVPPKNNINLNNYMGRGKKMFSTDAQDYIKALRKNDRL